MWREVLIQIAANPHARAEDRVFAKALLDLSDAVMPMVNRSDYATHATHSFVCTCPYKPFPHALQPAHAPFPKAPRYPLLPAHTAIDENG